MEIFSPETFLLPKKSSKFSPAHVGHCNDAATFDLVTIGRTTFQLTSKSSKKGLIYTSG